MDPRALGPVTLEEKGDGSGTVVFARAGPAAFPDRAGRRPAPPSFVGIPDARRVYGLVRAAPRPPGRADAVRVDAAPRRRYTGPMNKLLTLALLSSLAVVSYAKKAPETDPFKLIGAQDLAAAMKSEKPPVVLDANNADTRAKYGVVPGAVLLSNYKKFDLAKTLPADKSQGLVFYCANPKCMASHEAAKRAAKAGYKDVSVMSDGIMGWVESGHPVDRPKAD
ncbi:MAG: rhodanese-like domain-containing protein [Elusimicrobia bacterium]|nr:rhodanese-like domain-containing protein [Elusimicrobiota bacterium]